MDKILYHKARTSLYISLAGVIVMILNLFSPVKALMVTGLVLSFVLALSALVTGIKYLRFIYKNEEKYRGDSMCWIAISLAVIVLLSDLPFVITLFYAI